jgi:uncharacterized protein (DUF2336 family)
MKMLAVERAAPMPGAQAGNGIVRQLLAWAQRADSSERAAAASALARAWLTCEMPANLRREAEIGLTAMLDDPSSCVRVAIAEAFADAPDPPHAILVALAGDQSEIAAIVLARSPALSDAELIDCAATGDELAQEALASRASVSPGVCAALAEIGARNAVLALVSNPFARMTGWALRRVVERFGRDGAMREALLGRERLPAALRCDLARATAEALGALLNERGWLSPERAERIVREECEQATVVIAHTSNDADVADLMRRLRASGGLTIALLVRALLSGGVALFEAAMSELSGLPRERVAAFARDPRGSGFAALYRRAGLSADFFPVFRAILTALAEVGAGDDAALSLAMIERTIAICEKLNSGRYEALLSLLRRLESEAARGVARAYADDVLAAFDAPAAGLLPAPAVAIDALAALDALVPEVVAPEAPDAIRVEPKVLEPEALVSSPAAQRPTLQSALFADRRAIPTVEIAPARIFREAPPLGDIRPAIVLTEAPPVELRMERLSALDEAA